MSGCTHLRMLPELPLNIYIIDATECTSLETLSLRPESDFRSKISLINCDKLIKNQGYGDLLSTMLRGYIFNHEGLQGDSFHVEIPGSEIPKWFSHQNVGGSVNLQVPSNLLDIILSEEFGKIESYQLWLEYFPSTCFRVDYILDEVDVNGLSQIEVKFEAKGPGLEVTKCGAHWVFEQDIEDLINQTKAGPSNCIITPYDEDGFEDSEKDTKIKRSSDDSDGEGAGSASNDEPPHLKWIRHPDLIENCFYGICTADQLFSSLILFYLILDTKKYLFWTLLKRRNCHVAS
nr:disease resistance protein rps4 [Quercus suber]